MHTAYGMYMPLFSSSVVTIRAGTGDSLVPASLWEGRVALLGLLVIVNKMVARERMLRKPPNLQDYGALKYSVS